MKKTVTLDEEVVKSNMKKPLDQETIDMARHRIKELYPLYKIGCLNLFPYLCCCFNIK
jgi:hypothetical protein